MDAPYHRFDVTSWNVKAMRDKVGKPRINIYGPTFNFHPGAEGDRPAEPWSEMPMGIYTEFEGVPISNYKFSFRVSPQQDEWITNVVDEWAIDTLTATSAEWSSSKGGLKRDQVQKDYQPTIRRIRRKDGFDPLVSMKYCSNDVEEFHTVLHYIDAKEDGTWSSEPRRPVTGDTGLLDLMGEHKFRKAKVRVEARLSGFVWQAKNIYPVWELSKVFMKAPPTYAYDALLDDATIFVADPGAYHRFDVTSWNVKAMRDKVGKPRINIYGPTFTFHPGAEGDRPAEPWSEMPMGIYTEFEGVPISNYKFSFRVSPQQDEWITNVFDEWAIDTLTATSAEWSSSKGGLKRDQVQKDYQPTIRRKDGFDPLVSMNYCSNGMEKFHTVIHYLDAKEDGTWSSEPRRPVMGGAGLLDLMDKRKFRKAKVRVEARLSGFVWHGKNIYARWEMVRVFMKAPPHPLYELLNDATIFVADPGAWIPVARFLEECILKWHKVCDSDFPQPKEEALTSALAKLQARVVEDRRTDWANPGDPVHGTWILGLRGAQEFSPMSYMDQLEMTVVAPRWFEWKEECGWVESCAVDNLHDGLSRIAIPHLPVMNALVEIEGEDAANLLFSLHLSEQHGMHMLKDALGIHLIGYCHVLLRTHPVLLKGYIDNYEKGSGDRFHALIETGSVAREITKGGLSFLKRHSDQYPGCDDDEKLLWAVLREDLLWCPLLILPALSPRLRCREEVVGAIFERAVELNPELNPELRGYNAETWAIQISVLDAWKSVPPEAVAKWTTEGGSPRILAADPRLCMLLPECLDPQRAAVALRAFCTEEWKDKVPIALHTAWGTMALSRMGAGIFDTHSWEYMTHAERQEVLNGMSSIQDAVDFARALHKEAPYADIMLTKNPYFGMYGTDHYAPTQCSDVWKMLWRANVVRKELKVEHPATESLEILWTLARKTFDSDFDLSGIIESQPRLLGMQFCVQDITDEVVLSIAQKDAGHLKRLLPLPAAAASSEPWRKRRRGSRAAILAEEVLLTVGAGGWDALPQWLQEASDWQHLTCCICLTLPLLSLPTDDVRRCQNGHLVCSGCHETYLQHQGFTMRLGACPLCRQQGAWFVDNFATERLRGIALLPGLPCQDQPGV